MIEESNLPNVGYKLGGGGGYKSSDAKGYEFPRNPSVIAYAGESKTKDREILNG